MGEGTAGIARRDGASMNKSVATPISPKPPNQIQVDGEPSNKPDENWFRKPLNPEAPGPSQASDPS